jgi:hypothetical protein
MVTVARAPIAIAPNASMSQSGIMVAALLGGFVVFLALQGKLANYWSILLGGGASATSGATTTSPTTTTPGATTTAPAGSTTLLPSNASLGLPSSYGAALGLGGTSNPTAAATGGTGTATSTGIPGLPNTSLSQFFGLQ